jgi:hypothetical protein
LLNLLACLVFGFGMLGALLWDWLVTIEAVSKELALGIGV